MAIDFVDYGSCDSVAVAGVGDRWYRLG
jgi:hypothetical protein